MKNLVLSLIVVLGLGVGGVASATDPSPVSWFAYVDVTFAGALKTLKSSNGYGSPTAAVSKGQCDANKLNGQFIGIDFSGQRPFDGTFTQDPSCP